MSKTTVHEVGGTTAAQRRQAAEVHQEQAVVVEDYEADAGSRPAMPIRTDDTNLDQRHGPTPIDRRHVLSVASRIEVPKTGGMTIATTARYMSGSPFTIYNSNIDVNQNGQLDDPSPAGSYSGTGLNAMQDVKNDGGRFGAYGPDYFQVDIRAGWRRRIQERTIELFVDVFNLTNRTNWDNPLVANSDERLPNTFLTLTNLRGGSGFPRSVQFGTRIAF